METQQLFQKIKDNICHVISGKEDVVEKLIVATLCGGHVLLEDIPGTGKTMLAKALSRSVDCTFKRLQFTPDLLPSDITGVNMYNPKTGEFNFRPGCVFTNLLLGDEINRATPRTQSALLECMEEHQVTVDGVTYPMQRPFLVVATQNPVETAGTFPLPEAQLDRFLMRLSMGYPEHEHALKMLSNRISSEPIELLEPVASKEDLISAYDSIKKIECSTPVQEYILSLAELSRKSDNIRLGISPRGTLALLHASQAVAATRGRSFVTPDDVKYIAPDVLAHRIICRGSRLQNASLSSLNQIELLLATCPVTAG